MTDTHTISPYLTLPLRTEEETRTRRAMQQGLFAGSDIARDDATIAGCSAKGASEPPLGGAPGSIPGWSTTSAAEKAQAAFLEVATTASLIKLAKSKAHELDQRDSLSQAAFDELLLAECVWLCDGDELKAKFLASAALEG